MYTVQRSLQLYRANSLSFRFAMHLEFMSLDTSRTGASKLSTLRCDVSLQHE